MARHALSTTQREPAVIAGTIVAVIAAVITLVVAFGVNLTETQTEAILGVATVVAPLLAALLIRPRVTPNGKVVETVQADGTHIAGPASPLPTGTVLTGAQRP